MSECSVYALRSGVKLNDLGRRKIERGFQSFKVILDIRSQTMASIQNAIDLVYLDN